MIRSFVFNQSKLAGQDVNLDFLSVMLHDEGVHVWVDVCEGTDQETKAVLEGVFNFHPLAIEDCLAPSELPKVDDYENCVFMVIHGVDYSHDVHEFRTNELNMFIGKNFLVTVHRNPMRSVAATIDRVTRNAPAVARAPDRLTYTILDSLLENYGPALQELSSEIEDVEETAVRGQSREVLSRVLQLKRQVQRLRQIVGPQREVITRLAHGEFKIVRAHMLPYYRDLLDALVRISDRTDSYRDALTGVLHIYTSMQQMVINDFIKVLTVAATLALPILAVTSFYGMNFPLPELKWPHPHLWVFAVTGALTVLVWLWLRRRGG